MNDDKSGQFHLPICDLDSNLEGNNQPFLYRCGEFWNNRGELDKSSLGENIELCDQQVKQWKRMLSTLLSHESQVDQGHHENKSYDNKNRLEDKAYDDYDDYDYCGAEEEDDDESCLHIMRMVPSVVPLDSLNVIHNGDHNPDRGSSVYSAESSHIQHLTEENIDAIRKNSTIFPLRLDRNELV